MKKDRDEFDRLMNQACNAKDELAEIADALEELGFIRKSKSCMALVYAIEKWQNRG